MIDVYKVMHQKYHKECFPKFVMMEEMTGRTGRHSLYLYQERSNTDRRKYSFNQRSVTVWNTLTEHVVSAPDVNNFKARLDKLWNKEPMKYEYKDQN